MSQAIVTNPKQKAMKTIVLALLLACTGSLVQAQAGKTEAEKSGKTEHKAKSGRKESPETRALKALRMMTDKLALTEQQQIDIKPVLEEREAAKEKARIAYNEGSDELKKALRETRQTADSKLKALLTADQWTTFEELRKEGARRNKMHKGDRKMDPPSNKTVPEKSAD